MAIKSVIFSSKVYYPIVGCQEVALCLGADWADKTVSGYKLLRATSHNAGRYLGPRCTEAARFENPRGVELYQYTFDYDDDQINTEVATGKPYVLKCSDIKDIVSACLVEAMMSMISEAMMSMIPEVVEGGE
jgi:hypothetical protein